MAENKIKLNSLGAIEEVAPQYVKIGETVVTVHRFIPYEKMLEMIQWCIDYIINDRPFVSAPLKKIIKDFAVLNFFTNFDFSFIDEYKEMSEIYEEYDFIYRFNVMEKVLPFIDEGLIKFFNETLDETLASITAYRNSAIGIVDTLADSARERTLEMQEALDVVSDDEKNNRIVQLLKFAENIKAPESK